MRKFIKEYKWRLILSSVIILLPMLAGTLLWSRLPDSMTMHWDFAGNADGAKYKGFAVFGIPLIFLALQWLCLLITAADPGNKGRNKKLQGLVLWIVPVISLLVSGITYSLSMGGEVSVMWLIPALAAVLFIIFGNYLPKTSQNMTIGIKIPWTLRSEENWNKTHRFGGRLWVAGGFVILIAMLLPGNAVFPVMIADTILMVAAPTIYSYVLYRKQVKSGGLTPNDTPAPGFNKKVSVVSLVIVGIVLVVVSVLTFTGDIRIDVGEEALSIEASYYADLTVPYGDIDSVEFRESDDPGYRANGFGSARLRMGLFQNDEFGDYTRYTYIGVEVCIVLKSGNNVLVISGRDEAETRDIYEALQERVS